MKKILMQLDCDQFASSFDIASAGIRAGVWMTGGPRCCVRSAPDPADFSAGR